MSKRRSRALGAVAGACLAATLATTPAFANTTAQVSDGTLQITGDKAGDFVGIFADDTQVVIDVGENGSADFTFDRAAFTALKVDAGAGDDEVRFVGLPLSDKTVTADGGSGNDTLIGGASNETLLGGAGNDFVDGNVGADTALLGTGNDRFQWDPGDGSDVVEGEGGNDALDFHGSNAPEDIDVSANGPRVRLFRNVAAITMDFDGIESANVTTLGSADNVTVGDLTGTALKTADVDLSATGGAGDGAADRVIVNGTQDPDRVGVSTQDGKVVVSGLAAKVKVGGAETALDRVAVNTLAGDDTITSGVGLTGAMAVDVNGGPDTDSARYSGTSADDVIGIARDAGGAAAFAPGGTPFEVTDVEGFDVAGLEGADTITGQNGIGTLTKLTIDGDEGDDSLRGGDGNDLLLGGDGNDFVDGNIGADVARLGAGDDTFQWDPGDGSDSVEGNAGSDRMDFNGSNANENIDVLSSGGHVQLLRDIAAIAMDFGGFEGLRIRALGGTDAISLADLRGTSLDNAVVDLSATGGAGDGAADTVTLNGTNRPDLVQVTRENAEVVTSGLPIETRIAGSEPTDSLRINTFGGDDDVTIAPDVSGIISPFVNLGAGE